MKGGFIRELKNNCIKIVSKSIKYEKNIDFEKHT